VIGGTRMIPDVLAETWRQLRAAWNPPEET
jgi:hypothetical protein